MIANVIDKFLKCDFHMHSGSCYSRNYSNKEFIKKIEDVDLDCIAITDHNIIDIELYKQIQLNKKIDKILLGGIEINVRISDEEIKRCKLEVSTDVDYFHGVLLFDYKDIEIVWSKILRDVIIKDNPEIKENTNIKEISKKLEGKSFVLSDIQSALSNIEYYFIFHENKGDRNLSDYLKNGAKHNEDYKSKLFYYNNIYAVEGNKKNQSLCQELSNELNIIISRFFFSDAKKLDDIGKKFTWINFSGNFSDLILPFSDPETRIFTSDLNDTSPQENNNYLSELKMNLINDEKKIKKELILYFSPGLNGIIGARGSGKSMLGNILAGKEISKYSDYVDISSIEYKMKNCEFTKNVPKTKYLKQNELLKIYEEKNFSELDFIKETYKTILEEKRENIKNIITSINKNLEEEKNSILKFYEKYKGIIFWDFIQNNITKVTLLRTIEKKYLKNNQLEYEKTLETLKESSQNIINLIDDLDKIEFSNEFDETKDLYKQIEKMKKTSIINLEEVYKQLDETIKVFDGKDKKILKDRKSLIELFNISLGQFNSKIDNYASEQNKNKELLREFFKDIYILRKKIYDGHLENTEKLKKIFNDQFNRKLKLNKESSIVLRTKVEDEQKYDDIIKEQLKINNQEYSGYILEIIFAFNEFEMFKEKFNGIKFKRLNTFEEYITKYFENVKKKINEYGKIDLEILYNDKELSKFSPGKRSEILLEIFLHYEVFDNNEYEYIILDQPEDNLDTNTIINVLVNKIRKMKNKKQFFIISHSAPVIINSDSNIIICAEQNTDGIRYNSGKINDKELKNEIVSILDGGEKNLKMRLNKYNFNYKGGE